MGTQTTKIAYIGYYCYFIKYNWYIRFFSSKSFYKLKIHQFVVYLFYNLLWYYLKSFKQKLLLYKIHWYGDFFLQTWHVHGLWSCILMMKWFPVFNNSSPRLKCLGQPRFLILKMSPMINKFLKLTFYIQEIFFLLGLQYNKMYELVNEWLNRLN